MSPIVRFVCFFNDLMVGVSEFNQSSSLTDSDYLDYDPGPEKLAMRGLRIVQLALEANFRATCDTWSHGAFRS